MGDRALAGAAIDRAIHGAILINITNGKMESTSTLREFGSLGAARISAQ